MQMSDFLCDFCQRPWTDDIPMIEGHRGSAICGRCLTLAYTELAINKAGSPVPENEHAAACVMCLNPDAGPLYRSELREEAVICRTCAKRAAGVLHKDPDYDWRKPPAD